MKLLLILFLVPSFYFSQEVIYYKNNNILEINLIEANQQTISFKRKDNPDGPMYVIDKNKIELVMFQDLKKIKPSIIDTLNKVLYVSKVDNVAKLSALKYYKGYKENVSTILLSSIVWTPVVGCIPFIIGSRKELKKSDLANENIIILSEENFNLAYKKHSKKLRNKKYVIAYSLGSLFSIIGYGFIGVTAYLISNGPF